MDEIPMPSVLDPDRMVSNSRDDMSVHDKAGLSEDLEEALHQSCEYGQQLWRDLDAIRGYLLDSLPAIPSETSGRQGATSAAPTGPDDEDGWQNWMAAFAAVTSALAGPHGDSGYGMSEARREAQQRRAAPTVTGSGGRFTGHEYDGRQAAEDEHRAAVQRESANNDGPTGGPTDQGLPPGADDNGSGGGGTGSAADSGGGSAAGGKDPAGLLKTAGMTGLVVLAFRGLTSLLRPPARKKAPTRQQTSRTAKSGKAKAGRAGARGAGVAAALATREGLTN